MDVPGITPWQTGNNDFYLIHTAIVTPTIEPREWSLRIHGMVDREVVVTYEDLLDRRRTETWITLSCVSNRVGGDLVGNAWWGGVRLADLLAEAGVHPDADAVLQTSEDGWNCGTPLAALTDDREAMLALAMNGRPLPIDHGFPVRTIVPGLYGYVSACKWVVDMEVTRFDRIQAYWTGKGWSEQGPVKIASRIDVPSSGDEVPAGEVVVAGVAWFQHTGIKGVEVSLDGGEWQAAEVAPGPSDDTWVQWAITTGVEPGDHLVRVRAIGNNGEVQTGVERDLRQVHHRDVRSRGMDEGVQAVVLLHDAVDHLGCLVGAGHVQLVRRCTDTPSPRGRHRAVSAVGVRAVGHRDVRAALREQAGDRRAQPAAAPDDEGGALALGEVAHPAGSAVKSTSW
jgi:DMSO/TMAO reductase YedYZ molybdopterin-dependent catalytic subunit